MFKNISNTTRDLLRQIAGEQDNGKTAEGDRGGDDMERIAAAVARAGALLEGDDREHFERFVRVLYDRADYDDLDTERTEMLQAVALSFWLFAQDRTPGHCKLRVYNPDLAQDGWTSEHSILDIVTDDMPFLVDSVLGALNDLDLSINGILHPIVEVQRDEAGRRVALQPAAESLLGRAGTRAREGFIRESMMHVEFTRINDEEALKMVAAAIDKVMADVRVSVTDFRSMTDRLGETVQHLKTSRTPVTAEECDEIIEFLNWLRDGNFAFLGARDYVVTGDLDNAGDLVPDSESGLGLLRDPDMHVLRRGNEFTAMTPEVREFLRAPTIIIITKANVRSTVHRRVYLDYIGIKTFDADGNARGERRFVGLFTATAYNRNVRSIPLLRRKMRLAIERAGLPRDGHDEKALANILETFPRDELFQVSDDDLLRTSLGILRLNKRPRTKIFVRHDRFDRFVSVIVFVPRDSYDTALRHKMADLLTRAFDGRLSAFYPQFGDAPLARVHFIIGRNLTPRPEVDIDALEAAIAEAARDWADDLREALEARHGKAGRSLASRYGQNFTAAYTEVFPPEEAVEDIALIETLGGGARAIALRTYRRAEDGKNVLRLKLAHWDEPVALSDVLPIFEHMGLKVINETPHAIRFSDTAGQTSRGVICDGRTVWVHDFGMETKSGGAVVLERIREPFEAAILGVWEGYAEDDGFNRLVLDEGMHWRDVLILRACARFRRQAGTALSLDYMEETFANHGTISRLLVDLFHCRFDPEQDRSEEERQRAQEEILTRLHEAIDALPSLDADRILRQAGNLIMAMKRTNFFQYASDGLPKPYVSFKIASQELEELPLPKPFAEIYVYSPRFEGVHLRGGKVARGGLRWSDRREDFRTEVLGLVKAQQVKNAVIVPVGAKGGFVPKRLPEGGSREEIQEEAIACYRLFISALLDVTDNLIDGAVVPPRKVVRHDDDDPYLVVAADKGTATFSDIANEVAQSYGFWLGDAFASGGSAGYDHKGMGITARGAWEAVKRHFRELGKNIQEEPFTCVGVGDMSGDVFGNGMLRSRQTRLIAAFNHLHIFLDPDPDLEESFRERERLFNMSRSSWADYNEKKISKGGGVFDRKAKSIPLSPEVRAMLDVEAERLPPNELIRAILKAEADLLWFGGIGTYVKASSETDFEVNDRANDAVRVDADELRVKVVGEGANLGCTQRGRIEFAQEGGRINTDAVDNVSGVDTSDHEVNIKILLDALVRDGRLEGAARNALLASMRDEVAELVLRNNYRQTLALSIAEATAADDIDAYGRFMRLLERRGKLNRAIEYLPDEEALRERKEAGQALTRPEMSVLMAYAKITLFDDLLEGQAVDDAHLARDLARYFPRRIAEEYGDAIPGHRLKREIIATMLANDIVNTGGITFVSRICEAAGVNPSDVTRAYVAARDAFALRDLRIRVNDLDNKVPAQTQTELHLAVIAFLRRQVLWFLRYQPLNFDIGEVIARYAPVIEGLWPVMRETLSEFERAQCEERITAFEAKGVPRELAESVCLLEPMSTACDIADIAAETGCSVAAVAQVYCAMGAALELDALRAEATGLTPPEHWERMALKRAVEETYRQQRILVQAAIAQAGALACGPDGAADGAAIVAQWEEAHSNDVARLRQLFQDMNQAGPLSAAKLAITAAQMRDLALSPAGEAGKWV
jgi:glutamate dehydrogenase